MKLLALVTDGFGAAGGIATYNRHLLTALAGQHDARIVVLPRHGEAAPEQLPGNLQQLAPARGRLGYALRGLALAITGNFDAIFCGHIHLAPLAAAAARLRGRPMWLQLHGWEVWHGLTAARRWAARQAVLTTAVSRDTRRRFLGLLPVDPWRVRVLPNTLDDVFAPGGKPEYLIDRHALRGRRVLLTVGRFAAAERGKGHDRVIRALPAVAREYPEIVYLVVGDGDDRGRLETLAQKAGVADRVRFVGAVAASELADYYRLADAFAMPSTQEGFGIVFIEAAACGLPPIGGNRDGSLDALADGAIGRAVDPEDAAALVRAIIDTLAGQGPDPAEARRFRLANFAAHAIALARQLPRPEPLFSTPPP